MVSCSIHLIDNGVRGFFKPSLPDAEQIPGLVHVQRLTAAEFSGHLWPTPPQLSRNGFMAFWEDDDLITQFLESADAGQWSGGWHARSNVTRAIGRWPGLPSDIDRSIHTESDGPVIGISIGPLRLSKGLRFNTLNTAVEKQLLSSEGVIWKSAFFAPKTITCSMSFWESAASLHKFARTGAHVKAMQASVDKDVDPSLPDGTKFFAPDLVFMSLKPYRVQGSLSGKNPLPESVFGSLDWSG